MSGFVHFGIWLPLWALIAALIAVPDHRATTPSTRGVALVELFTSEGCSSCPPADAQLERIVREAEQTGRPVFGLSFHVDYWDRLGWKDRFSSATFTSRQAQYADRFGLTSLYTPQMIVNGTSEFVGSNSSAAKLAIDRALSQASSITPELTATTNGLDVTIHCTSPHAPTGATLFVAWVESQVVSSPNRGENEGRKLRHANVVRDLRSIELTSSFDGNVRLQRPELRDGSVIAWIQARESGPVLGAASVRIEGK